MTHTGCACGSGCSVGASRCGCNGGRGSSGLCRIGSSSYIVVALVAVVLVVLCTAVV